MATCGSFHHIFENPKTEKPPKTLLESLSSPSSWSHQPTTAEDETPSFTEIFGELHFRDRSANVFLGNYDNTTPPYASTPSLQLCTEGLGSESSYDVEDVNVNVKVNVNVDGGEGKGVDGGEAVRRRRRPEEYPPAMKRMSLKARREEGRFVLEEVRVPRREILRARRQDGRLRMKLIQPHDDDDEDEDDDDEEEEEEGDIHCCENGSVHELDE